MSNRTTRRRWPWIILGIIAFIAVVAIGTSGTKPATTPSSVAQPSAPSSTATASPASSTAPPPATSLGAGTYEVGTDIQPGTYRTAGADNCYYERDNDLDGSIDSIITNDLVTGPGVMHIASTDKYVKIVGDCTWTRGS